MERFKEWLVKISFFAVITILLLPEIFDGTRCKNFWSWSSYIVRDFLVTLFENVVILFTNSVSIGYMIYKFFSYPIDSFRISRGQDDVYDDGEKNRLGEIFDYCLVLLLFIASGLTYWLLYKELTALALVGVCIFLYALIFKFYCQIVELDMPWMSCDDLS